MSQAIPLVPSIREDIKADLTSCRGEGDTQAKGEKEANDMSLKENVPFDLVGNWSAKVDFYYLSLLITILYG